MYYNHQVLLHISSTRKREKIKLKQSEIDVKIIQLENVIYALIVK